MLYLGRHQLGCHLPFLVSTWNHFQRHSAAPASAPDWTMTRLSTGVVVATGKMAPDWNSDRPVFRYAKFLTGMTPGTHLILVRYISHADGDPGSGVPHFHPMMFELVPGGSADGAITTVFPYNRGEEQYLIHSTDAGEIFAGRRPRF